MTHIRKESIILRNEPKFEIILGKDQFEIVNIADQNKREIYNYSLIDKVELKREKTNWMITIISYLVEFLSGMTGGGGYYKEKNKLVIVYCGDQTERLLTGCDMDKTNKAIRNLQSKINRNSDQTKD